MGEAKRRGSFEQRKISAVAAHAERKAKEEEQRRARQAALKEETAVKAASERAEPTVVTRARSPAVSRGIALSGLSAMILAEATLRPDKRRRIV